MSNFVSEIIQNHFYFGFKRNAILTTENVKHRYKYIRVSLCVSIYCGDGK